MDAKKMMKEMDDYGFAYNAMDTEVQLMKSYKCYLSKKCNDEKYARIKRMFDYCKDDPNFKKHMGNDFEKLSESFTSESRGQVQKIDFDGMSIMDVFMQHKMGVKEVCKKGYKVEDDTYIKI